MAQLPCYILDTFRVVHELFPPLLLQHRQGLTFLIFVLYLQRGQGRVNIGSIRESNMARAGSTGVGRSGSGGAFPRYSSFAKSVSEVSGRPICGRHPLTLHRIQTALILNPHPRRYTAYLRAPDTVMYNRTKDVGTPTGDWVAELSRTDAWFKNVVPNVRSAAHHTLHGVAER